jgi:hypothetical protein
MDGYMDGWMERGLADIVKVLCCVSYFFGERSGCSGDILIIGCEV